MNNLNYQLSWTVLSLNPTDTQPEHSAKKLSKYTRQREAEYRLFIRIKLNTSPAQCDLSWAVFHTNPSPSSHQNILKFLKSIHKKWQLRKFHLTTHKKTYCPRRSHNLICVPLHRQLQSILKRQGTFLMKKTIFFPQDQHKAMKIINHKLPCACTWSTEPTEWSWLMRFIWVYMRIIGILTTHLFIIIQQSMCPNWGQAGSLQKLQTEVLSSSCIFIMKR